MFARALSWCRTLAVLGLLCVTGFAAAFDYDDLVELIETRQLTSIEQVLAHLPKEYKENFTLAFNSRSLHGSSMEAPRVILFGRTGTLVLTFNGAAEQEKYQELEIVQFREESGQFEMRSIAFDDGVSFSEG